MTEDKKALFAAIGMMLCFVVMLDLFVWKGFQVIEATNKADAAESQLERCRAGSVPIDEYRQIVRSYDNLNDDLRECVEYMDEQAYLLEQMHVVRQFMPDSTEAEMHQLCEDCSANCEDALDWCYYYREEACYCLDDFEEGLQ